MYLPHVENPERKTILTSVRGISVQGEYSRSTIDSISDALRKILDHESDIKIRSKKLIANLDMLKHLTNSADIHVHYIDEDFKKIQADIGDIYVSSEDDLSRSGHSQTEKEHICEAVAKLKESVIANEISTLDKIFSKGVLLSNVYATNLICIPIMNMTKDRCYMVIELNRENNKPYSQVDIKLVNCAAEWIALSISQKEGQRLNEGNFTLNMKLRSYVENYFLGRIEHIEFISKVMLLTKNIIGISRVFFYTTHTRINTYNSYADLYEDVMTPTGFKMVKHPQQFKLHREKGLASYVVRTGLPINYTYAADNAIRLDAEIQKVFHFPLKNSLCMPVKYNNNVIAVIQLLNKKDDKDFTEYDEIILERICMYVSLVQHFEKIKELCELEYARCEIIEDQIGYQLTTLATVPLYIKLTEADLPEGFNDFAWYPEKNEEMLVPWFFYMFKATCSDMIRDEDDLYEFIVNIMKCHRALPFRNFLHTFDALHLLYCIVQRVGERLTKLETFALFLGGCCDGLNSEGFSSQYYTVINHPIIRIYDPPHFRNFQLSFLKRLLTMNKLLDHLSEDDRNKLMKLCGDAVVNLSSSHGGNSSVKLKKILDEGKFDDENPQHRSYQLTLLMRCACKGRVAKPFRIAKRLCEDIYRELYAQGDYFKTMKLIPPTWMDRQNVLSIPENEVEYIKVKCLPIYELLKRMFPSTAELYNLVRELQKAWKLMIELRYKKAWNPDESIGKGLEDTTR